MYFVLAFYHFKKIPDPKAHIKEHKDFLSKKDARSRIYINEEGINGQMSIHEQEASTYIGWLKSFDFFKDLEVKIHEADEHAFAKLTVKYRKELVAIDAQVDMKDTGKHLSPKEWKEMIEKKDPNTILVDVRNEYEWKVGHFEEAILPNLKTFKDFKEYIDELKHKYAPSNTKVMMYCTGGIRCEIYSCLMKNKGFDNVFQLEGGVIKYGQEEGDKHWKGKLFVFDDRMVVPLSKDNTEIISQCHACCTPSDKYYNCANMDCNKLFIACPDCAKKLKGCCSEECVEAPRVRAFDPSETPKPFKKLDYSIKSKLNEKLNKLDR